jgi:[phosphatase 2A protein]-leucine-carboxy methyltransferase
MDHSLPTLFLTECVLVYLDSTSSESLLKWVTNSFETCLFVNYEQLNIADTFGAVMVRNLHSCGCVLAGIDSCKDAKSQEQRFLDAGCEGAQVWTLNDVLQRLPRSEVERVERLEFLDERELLVQLLQHYCLCTAWKDPKVFGLAAIDFS